VLPELQPSHVNLRGKRLLIFVVAYNAESTIEKVLSRIPSSLHCDGVEVLIIDDSSGDNTFASSLRYQQGHPALPITVLRTPENQGYGGNQKLGYRYAIDHGFDFVALVHGDGQYAPEKLPELVAPLIAEQADAVFGSRMIDKQAARRGGMPMYKWIGNQLLTAFQNRVLGTKLSEFHTGYRLYSTKALAQVPFERNTNDFHFDTEIIIQFVLKRLRIAELPIPTFYGDEVCYVNGLKYAFNICCSTLKARLCGVHLFYDRRFDVNQSAAAHSDKLGFPSSQTYALRACVAGRYVLQLGIGNNNVAAALAEKLCHVTAVDFGPSELSGSTGPAPFAPQPSVPNDVARYHQIVLMDLIEHVNDPESFMDDLRTKTNGRRPELIITAANIAFCITRFMLLIGRFSYSRKGVIGIGRRRLFTFTSLRQLLEQSGYEILEERGIPAPFPLAIGLNRRSRGLIRFNQMLIWFSRRLFAYQIFIRARAMPEPAHLLTETLKSSSELRDQLLSRVA
jgi:glycosyltransferase involved in cell wall biosynthesis